MKIASHTFVGSVLSAAGLPAPMVEEATPARQAKLYPIAESETAPKQGTSSIKPSPAPAISFAGSWTGTASARMQQVVPVERRICD